MGEEIPRLIKVKLVPKPSVRPISNSGVAVIDITAITKLGPCWMDPIIDFLAEDSLLGDEKEGNKIHRMALRYWLSKDWTLYRRFFGGPYLLCLRPEKVSELLVELHEGVCGNHVGGRSLAHRAMTQGFWWPQMQKDATAYVLKCEQCQKHAPLIHQPAGHLIPISSNRRFVLVAVDYFTKWVEAEALANIRDVDVKKFVWKNIVTRFGVPDSLISDNGLQFDRQAFREFCGNLNIKNRYSTPSYPQGNGQAEAVNKVIVNGLKKRLEGAKGNWAKELPKVLWAYRTTPRRSTEETPFSLTYGAEAVIPTEVNLLSVRVAGFDPTQNEEMMAGSLDKLEECHERVTIRLVEYQQKLAQRYSRDVRTREFSVEDLVLKRAVGNIFGIKDFSNINNNLLSGKYRILGISRFFGFDGSFLNKSLWNRCFFSNRSVCKFSEVPGHALCRLVAYWGKLVRTSVSLANLPSFSYNKVRRQKVRMPNVDIRQEGAIHQECLLKGLPGGVNWFNSENKVGRSELPVPVNEYLGLKHEV
ncbi:uncharacterized protein LOC112040954 [Quercus suber]|uniref:uncharacterized protein LOC112040954 n=1 Tax=Quercus suber TaxID=58331 RepID=UPI000CE17BF3|nr:uncharacterized protein LOC112040954 [Quercus suber]